MVMNRRSRILSFAAVTMMMAAFSAPAAAQQVSDPTRAEFNPSPDHNTILPDGSSAVQSYQLELRLQGAALPFQTASLGKPNPDPDGIIRVDLTTVFVGWPIPGTVYEADVAAVGPGGSANSALSNTFVFSTQCSATVTPLTQTVSGSAGAGSSSVAAATGCAWTATSNATWITITAGSSGTGNGTTSYAVAANTAATARTGTVTVAGQTVTVNQNAACTFTVAPTTQSVAATAGTGSATITAAVGCSWTATSNATWITITAGSSGTGNGTTS